MLERKKLQEVRQPKSFLRAVVRCRMTGHRRNEYIRGELGITDFNKRLKWNIKGSGWVFWKECLEPKSQRCSSNV